MASSAFSDKSIPGGIVFNQAMPYSREMAKWEMDYNKFGEPGRPRDQVGYQAWPAMFYKMKRSEKNGDFIVEHSIAADDEVMGRNLESRGYRNGMVAAIEYVKSCEQALAVGAAERNYQDRNMSEKAKAEIEAVEASTSQHVAVVPETPIKRRGRPRKVQP